ncbi:hypothetical protein BDV37DRAFT_289475 [Aspergillus pseudonomiae]|uniref:J domain-containing protein n=1 Tax=Aspergillus pseudonomiae TaxID=1506151 RepID=A0A5N7CT60_9EURO|nr:uncharacterized protein BDV37DRAFT_289475 [Aspergillus pseudonomiae]KAE8397386.1 hypothetical protein BDV37DRAFT_289475 [Aspergillus pseudonomiae]
MGKSAKRKREREKALLEQGQLSQRNVDNDGDELMDRDNAVGHADSTESKTLKNGHYTLEQRQVTTRIMLLHEKDYYNILGLQRDCTMQDIRKAYLKLGRRTHPDQNRYKDAPIAFKRLAEAYDVLHKPKSRAQFDLIGDQYETSRTRNAETVFGEAFAENAAGDESEDASDEEDSEEEYTQPKPQVEVERVYMEATELVNQYLALRPVVERHSAERGIVKLNKKIKEINRESGLPEHEGSIKMNLLQGFAESYRTAAQGNNLEDLTRIRKQFDYTKKNHYYPSSWQLPEIPGIKYDPSETEKRNLADQETAEQIIGYIPSSRFCGPSFIVRTPNLPTGMLIEQYGDTNRDMAEAYLALPEAEKKDVRGSQERYSKDDRTKYDRILGWCNVLSSKWNPDTRGCLPKSYGLIRFKDGRTDILSRTALRKVLGVRAADAQVNRFYWELGITPPWAAMPRFQALPGLERALIGGPHSNTVRNQGSDKVRRSGKTRRESQDRTSEDTIRTLVEQNQKQQRQIEELTSSITKILQQIQL